MFERYLRIRETLLSNIHAAITAPASAIPSTPIDANPTDGEPSRKRPAEDDSAISAKRCRLEEQPVPLQHLNPTGGEEARRKLSYAPAEPLQPGRSPGVSVLAEYLLFNFLQPSGL